MIRLTDEERLEERKEGIKEGRQEGKIEVAKAMLLKGIPLNFVVECTNLKEEVVEGLSKEIKPKSKKMDL